MCDTYNGWPNFPTWSAFCWLTSDQFTEERVRCMALRAAKSAITEAREQPDRPARLEVRASDILAAQLHDYLACEPFGGGFHADLHSWALGRVDYHRLADAFLEDHSIGWPV